MSALRMKSRLTSNQSSLGRTCLIANQDLRFLVESAFSIGVAALFLASPALLQARTIRWIERFLRLVIMLHGRSFIAIEIDWRRMKMREKAEILPVAAVKQDAIVVGNGKLDHRVR